MRILTLATAASILALMACADRSKPVGAPGNPNLTAPGVASPQGGLRGGGEGGSGGQSGQSGQSGQGR